MRSFKAREQGSILFICLFVVVVLSILATSVLNITVLQERMSGNFLEQKYSFMAADSVLVKAAERIRFDKDLTTKQVYEEVINENRLRGEYTYKSLGSFSYTNSIGTDNTTYTAYEVKAVGFGREGKDAKTTLVATYILKD